ncbi:helix-turn-helix domain-containing protein [Mesorhizobium sp. M7A.F.Ca.US.001.04.2.1]|nr:helix-turn-helix domain-containing protein [Mesorhizobium sp. M7A.F.Ca.US.001.04.2.1]
MLGMSERQFRRYRERYEEAGEAGLLDRRLGKLSTRRVPRRGSRRCWNFIATATLAGT